MIETKKLSISLWSALLLCLLLPVTLLAQSNDLDNSQAETVTELDTTVSNPSTAPNNRQINPLKPANVRPTDRNLEKNKPTVLDLDKVRPVPNQDIHLNRPEQPNLEERRAQLQKQIEAKRAEMLTNNTERKTALAAKAQERISNLSATISDRLQRVLERLNQIITRIESRIEKLEENNIDTTEAQRHLANAKSELANAMRILSDIDQNIVLTVTSENPRSSWSEVKTAYQTIHKSIKSAHASLRSSVNALKSARSEIKEDQSTNPEVTNDQTE